MNHSSFIVFLPVLVPFLLFLFASTVRGAIEHVVAVVCIGVESEPYVNHEAPDYNNFQSVAQNRRASQATP